MTAATPLIIPGGQRCGSTWLLTYLNTHARVSVRTPVRPEPKVFLAPDADADTWWDRCGPLHPSTYSWVIEKSTSYLENSVCADRIGHSLPDARVVVIVRDPTERAISNWRFSTANGREQRPIERALDPDEAEPNGLVSAEPHPPSASAHRYLPRGHYADLLAPWLYRFRDRIDVVVLEELLDQQPARHALWDRLDLGGSAPAAPAPVNESTTGDTQLDPNVRRRLHRYFAPHQEALQHRLGRALPWPVVHSDGSTAGHRP